MKLRLTGNGFQNYTGQMGIHYFENGISVYDVRPTDAMRIAGTIGAEWVDGSPANVSEIYAAGMQVEAPTSLQIHRFDALAQVVGVFDASQIIAHTQAVAEMQFKADGIEVPDQKAKESTTTQEVTEQTPTATTYTREQLEAIVDEKGLTGLREVGHALGVKASSINDLIDRILDVAGVQAEAE